VSRFPALPAFLAQILYNRGLTDPVDAEAFLSDARAVEHDPLSMSGMGAAVRRIHQAIAGGEQVVVYGDFDVDGLTATAVLVEALRSAGGRVDPYIPSRDDEGYGLNLGAVERLCDAGIGLLITVDCGISSVTEITFAAGRGLDVIVTDHHHVPPTLPPALAIVNPRQPGCQYPFKDLAGVGVAYKLASAVLPGLGDGLLPSRSALDLVALGTVADMVPLTGENRSLVQRGLRALRDTPRPGLRELIRVAGTKSVDSESISFALAPRLNSAGRLADAYCAYQILVTDDLAESRDLAAGLEGTNQERQGLTRRLEQVAEAQICSEGGPGSLLFVSGAGFRAGVVGLVAGKLAETHYRPAVVVEQGEETSRGSARSIPEFNIVCALEECRDLLVRFGGHAQAAGFTVENGNLSALRGRLADIAARELAGVGLDATLAIDTELPIAQASWGALRHMESLAPFGYGNPQPTLLARRARVVGYPKVVGSDHLRLRLADSRSGLALDAIAFRMGSLIDGLSAAPLWDVVYTLGQNEWGGNAPVLQMNVKDMRPASHA
jgi:single-stranded-DNA-specific exonuclease